MVEVEGRIGGRTEVGLGIWIGWGWHIFSTACFVQFWLLLLYCKPQPVHTQRNRDVSLFCTVQSFPYFLLLFLHTGVCRYGWFSAVQMPVHLNCSKDVTFSCTTPHVSWRDEPFRICYEQLDRSVIMIRTSNAFAIDLRHLMAQAFCGQEWSPKWRLERNSRLNGRSGSWPSRK